MNMYFLYIPVTWKWLLPTEAAQFVPWCHNGRADPRTSTRSADVTADVHSHSFYLKPLFCCKPFSDRYVCYFSVAGISGVESGAFSTRYATNKTNTQVSCLRPTLPLRIVNAVREQSMLTIWGGLKWFKIRRENVPLRVCVIQIYAPLYVCWNVML